MPRSGKQKKARQKKLKQKRAKQEKAKQNLDFRVIPRSKDTRVRRLQPDVEEWQQENVQPKRVRCRLEKVSKSMDEFAETMHVRMKELDMRLKKNMSDAFGDLNNTIEDLNSSLDELKAGLRELHARIDIVALNMVLGLSLKRTRSDEDEDRAFRALHTRILLDRSRQTAAQALGLAKWEDIREKGNAHAQIAFFKSTAEALPDSPRKDRLLAIGNDRGALGMLLSRGNKIRNNFSAHHSEQSALRQAVGGME